MKNFGWDSEFRKFLRLRILDIVFVPAMGILDIVLTASVLKALFCEDLWMGAQSFKGFCVWGFGISISCPMMLYGDLGYRSCRLRPRGLVYQEFWMGLKVSNNFGSGILAIVFRARYGDFGYRSHRQGTRAIGL